MQRFDDSIDRLRVDNAGFMDTIGGFDDAFALTAESLRRAVVFDSPAGVRAEVDRDDPVVI